MKELDIEAEIVTKIKRNNIKTKTINRDTT